MGPSQASTAPHLEERSNMLQTQMVNIGLLKNNSVVRYVYSNQVIPKNEKSMKYAGMYIGNRFTWRHHII